MSSWLRSAEMFPQGLTRFLIVTGFFGTAVFGADLDPCSSSPCQNEGTCSSRPGSGTFTCSCLFGFSGLTCQLRSKCTFKHIVEGVKNTEDIDIAKLSGLNMTVVDDCKQKCQDTPGCRAIDLKNSSCQIFRMVPLSVPNLTPMRCEKGRVFAIRRCFKRKTADGSANFGEPSKTSADATQEANTPDGKAEEPTSSDTTVTGPQSSDTGEPKVSDQKSSDTGSGEPQVSDSDQKSSGTGAKASEISDKETRQQAKADVGTRKSQTSDTAGREVTQEGPEEGEQPAIETRTEL